MKFLGKKTHFLTHTIIEREVQRDFRDTRNIKAILKRRVCRISKETDYDVDTFLCYRIILLRDYIYIFLRETGFILMDEKLRFFGYTVTN